MKARPVTTDEDILACHDVLVQLRPDVPVEGFVERAREMMADGYRLAAVAHYGHVVCVAGYRIAEKLAWGRHLYVDDLVTDVDTRTQGAGAVMFEWLVDKAREEDCGQIHVDSNVHRHDAHRFYFRQDMRISSHHFQLDLEFA